MSKIKVALCQINTTIGDFTNNVDKICAFLEKAGAHDVDLAVFPELTLSSYPPLDLLDRPAFIKASQDALELLKKKIASLDSCPKFVAVGSVYPNPSPKGRAILNTVVVLSRAKVEHVQAKRLLPTYDVFDEARYFEAGKESTVWESPFGKIGFVVCEDAWFEDTVHGRQIYSEDPADQLKGLDLVVNLSASPFELNKKERREEMISHFVTRVGAASVYVNSVGANDEILFDGGSLVYGKDGKVLYKMPHFCEALAVVEIDSPNSAKEVYFHTDTQITDDMKSEAEMALLHEGLVTGIRDYFAKTGFSKAVLGLSGGLDSAVVACLAAEALGPSNVCGVSMPSIYSSTQSYTDAEALSRKVGIEHRSLSIKFIFKTVMMELKNIFLGAKEDVTEENVQARLRGMMVMAIANKRNALALSTGNKSELAVGYCTSYGDMAGAISPIGDVYKTKVYELARYINKQRRWIPDNIINKPPSAELRKDQKDEDSLGPYEQLDPLLEAHFEGLMGESELIEKGFKADYVQKILHLTRISEHKRRQAPIVLKTTTKAFGIGRRMPVAKNFKSK